MYRVTAAPKHLVVLVIVPTAAANIAIVRISGSGGDIFGLGSGDCIDAKPAKANLTAGSMHGILGASIIRLFVLLTKKTT